MILNNPIPPNPAGPQTMISVFREFVEDLPLLERTDAAKRFEKALPWQFIALLAGDLATDHYWNERITILQECTLSFLLRVMLEGVPDVDWIDGLQVGTLIHRDVMARADEVWSPLSCLYWRADEAIEDKEFWDYYTEESAIDTARPCGAGKSGQCSVNCFGKRRPGRILWEWPMQLRCAVGGGSAFV